MTRGEILRLLTVQNLLMLIFCFGWLMFFPRPAFWQSIRIEPLLLGCLPATAVLFLASLLALRWIPPLRRAQAFLDQELFRQLRPRDAVYVSLLPGVAEEMLFRGLLQPAWGLAWTSLAFGLMHLPALRHWSYAVWAALMGLLLGSLYLLSGNLLLVILTHLGNNTLSLLLWPRFRERLLAG